MISVIGSKILKIFQSENIDMFDKTKLGCVGVLMGGYSSEREISLKSGKAILAALKEEGLHCLAVDIRDEDEVKIAEQIRLSGIDLAFIALHGKLGEDGKIQAILEKLDIPYSGSGVKASQIALNKVLTQKLLKENGINVAPHLAVKKKHADQVRELILKNFSFPIVVKPSCEGSSIGVSLVKDDSGLVKALESAWQFGHEILIEKFIKGRELTVGILGEEALPIVEIVHQGGFFDFQAKYQSQSTNYVVPAPLPVCLSQEIRAAGLKVHQLLGCADLSRIDFILGEDERYYVLEVNTIPGFTSSSLLPKAAREAGINFNQLCLKLILSAYGKKKNKNPALSR